MKSLKRRTLIGLIVVMTLFAPALAAAAPQQAGPVTISYDFQWIRQGHVGIVRVNGADVAEVRAIFQERVYHFYPEKGAFIGLISADMDQDVGEYPMQVWVKYTDDSGERLDKIVEVNYGEFGRSEVTVSPSLMPLLEPEVEEVENAKMFNLITRFTPEGYWADQGFVTPTAAVEIIGWFGAWRLYNGTYWRRHSGSDYRIPSSTPVNIMASGRVVLAEELSIRGNYVLIDHGWGIYSGYAHLSQILVVPGQWVRQGDVIGLSGNTGRSSGAHLHWEVAVGGAWTDPDSFVALELVE